MPAKNSIKIYAEGGFYHIYNRGVAKNDIFLDGYDYSVFLSYLKTYLLPKDIPGLQAVLFSDKAGYKEKYEATKLLKLRNFNKEIELLAYALLPNHFHLLVKQNDADSINQFMGALGTRYSGFFNRKYHRVGPICQGVYKAVLVTTDEQLLHVSRYIHLNPFTKLNMQVSQWNKSPWPTSLPDYLEQRHTEWIKSATILNYFKKESKNNSYLNFIDENIDAEFVAPLALDFEDEP